MWALVFFVVFGCGGGSNSAPGPVSVSVTTQELTGTYVGTFGGNRLDLWLSDINVEEMIGGFITTGVNPINVRVRGTLNGEMLMLRGSSWEFWAFVEEDRLDGTFINTVTGATGAWEVLR